MQHPGRIGQVRTRDGAEIGTAGGDDGIGMIGLRDRADSDRGDPDLVADLVGERGLVKPPVHRMVVGPDLARRAVDQIGAGFLEQFCEFQRVVRRVAAFGPVVARQAH